VVKGYEPRNFGLIRGEQPIQMIVDIGMELDRSIGIMNCGVDRIAVQYLRHFSQNSCSSVSEFGIGAAQGILFRILAHALAINMLSLRAGNAPTRR
jgi:hypothetical protein